LSSFHLAHTINIIGQKSKSRLSSFIYVNLYASAHEFNDNRRIFEEDLIGVEARSIVVVIDAQYNTLITIINDLVEKTLV